MGLGLVVGGTVGALSGPPLMILPLRERASTSLSELMEGVRGREMESTVEVRRTRRDHRVLGEGLVLIAEIDRWCDA